MTPGLFSFCSNRKGRTSWTWLGTSIRSQLALSAVRSASTTNRCSTAPSTERWATVVESCLSPWVRLHYPQAFPPTTSPSRFLAQKTPSARPADERFLTPESAQVLLMNNITQHNFIWLTGHNGKRSEILFVPPPKKIHYENVISEKPLRSAMIGLFVVNNPNASVIRLHQSCEKWILQSSLFLFFGQKKRKSELDVIHPAHYGEMKKVTNPHRADKKKLILSGSQSHKHTAVSACPIMS